MKLGVGLLVGTLLLIPATALAQHSTDDQGPKRYGYHGDTWTGTVSSVDHEKNVITLEYEHNGKTESFTGTLKPPLQVLDENGNPAKPPIHIQAGDRLRVYYVKQGAKYAENGSTHEEVAADNLIIQIRFMPAKKP